MVDLADVVGTAIDRLAHREGVLHEGKEFFPTLIAYRRACALAELKARREDGRRAAQVDDVPRLQQVIHRVGIAG